ncbi:two-component system response regulator [Niastella yeongjuensis]|uniref:Two-component system response regulator n=1 Tax=Niastella yeongjuensis TaxID=354355 RepID=A0A1V9EAI6_9BACT|nr:response regulator transcription factor [Niastella yeongjuensis]OQP42945.1 two-component system response regulator [Niastella yeongjuensis]SEO60462.1 DNA-binding response regulator, OmpR family, contains REC and winged-helix (wHTH) domain [Niastella yeongjuensis]
MNKIKVLLVDDEPVLAAIIKESLEMREFTVHIALNGIDGWNQFKELRPDICVIDVVLPRKDGFALVSEIRLVDENVPVMFLTARSETENVIRGLEAGADDYMKKPFSMEELVLRLKVLLRRRSYGFNTRLDPSEEIKIGRYVFNARRLELSWNREIIQLSQREAELLQLLIDVKNSLLDRKTALIKLWGKDDFFSARSMDVYITRIRKYFRPDTSVEIVNIRGKGYSLLEHS